jgi:hypothetical protein
LEKIQEILSKEELNDEHLNYLCNPSILDKLANNPKFKGEQIDPFISKKAYEKVKGIEYFKFLTNVTEKVNLTYDKLKEIMGEDLAPRSAFLLNQDRPFRFFIKLLDKMASEKRVKYNEIKDLSKHIDGNLWKNVPHLVKIINRGEYKGKKNTPDE